MHYPVWSVGNVNVIKKVISDFDSARQFTSSHYDFCSFDLGKTRFYWEKSIQTIDIQKIFLVRKKILNIQPTILSQILIWNEHSNILNILTSELSLAIAIRLSRSDICVISVVFWRTLADAVSILFIITKPCACAKTLYWSQSKVTCY